MLVRYGFGAILKGFSEAGIRVLAIEETQDVYLT